MPFLRTIANVLGAICLAVAAYHGIEAHVADSNAQSFRNPQAPLRSFVFIPLRWKPDLYTEPGRHFVEAARRHMTLLYLYGVIAAGLLLFGNPGP
jgi:hypothetical protein